MENQEHVLATADIRYVKTKLAKITTIVFLVVVAISLVIGITSATYSGHSDGGKVINPASDLYMTYWSNTEERSLSFKDDGTVYYTSLYDMTVLAYPSSISKPEGFHNEYDGTYKSFKVRVTLGGEVYVDIGGSSYRVTVNDNNVPTKIHDYYGMTLR